MKAVTMTLVAGLFTGCHNYTTTPLCDESNKLELSELPGAVGNYSLTIQHQDFRTETMEIEVTEGEVSPQLKKAMFEGEDEMLCEVDGWVPYSLTSTNLRRPIFLTRSSLCLKN